jgi:hypothetical protein
MGNKTVVTDAYKFTNKAVRLNFGIVPNGHILLNFNKRTNKTVIANIATVKVYWFNNLAISTETDINDFG